MRAVWLSGWPAGHLAPVAGKDEHGTRAAGSCRAGGRRAGLLRPSLQVAQRELVVARGRARLLQRGQRLEQHVLPPAARAPIVEDLIGRGQLDAKVGGAQRLRPELEALEARRRHPPRARDRWNLADPAAWPPPSGCTSSSTECTPRPRRQQREEHAWREGGTSERTEARAAGYQPVCFEVSAHTICVTTTR